MASTEPTSSFETTPVTTLQALAADDQSMLDRLVLESNWNQTPADWRFFFRQGRILVMRDAEGRIVASGALLPMDPDTGGRQVAWISMILVLPDVRGRGLGKRLFEACLRGAQAADCLPMLDATPLGEPLYTQFGFQPVSRITRWRREACAGKATSSLPLDKPDLQAMAALDQQALGFGRSALISELQGRSDTHTVCNPNGFALVRAGRTAHHIGPMLAVNEDAATALLHQVVASFDAPLLIDAPQERLLMAAQLSAAGFAPQRPFTRMCLVPPGRSLPLGQPRFIHAIAGPEFA